MSRILFKTHRFGAEQTELIRHCISVVKLYQGQGLRLTLRQLYYQLVTKNIIRNEEKSYKKLGNVVSDARLMGLIDWDAIEDRVRVPRIQSEWPNPKSLMESALRAYRLPRWKDQPNYVELWVEKDALAGILQPIAAEYHVPMMVNRGYSSQSAMHDAAVRFIEAAVGGSVPYKTLAAECEVKPGDKGYERMSEVYVVNREEIEKHSKKELFLLYLGDHDPSGEDMVRDIGERLAMFGALVEVRKLALTMDQVEEYEPPPNPAKLSDSRAEKYIAKHGAQSWEVDALPPDVLDRVIREALDEVVDDDLMQAWLDREAEDKKAIRKAANEIMKKRDDGPTE